jgi:FtsH-binding integral membrane protein
MVGYNARGGFFTMEHDVFERKMNKAQSKETIEAFQYNFLIGLVLLWGFGVNWWIVKSIPVQAIQSINFFIFLIGYFACCFLGVYLFRSSSNPWVSFLGYNFVVVPFGLIINLVVSQYDPSIVIDAMRITGFVTLIMMILGTLFPHFFQKISGALTVALLVVLIVVLVEIFVFGVHHGIIDWIVALIFCGYIGYDWGRANNIPKTVDNAVDSAAALYMDIINLFLRILRILGRRRR